MTAPPPEERRNARDPGSRASVVLPFLSYGVGAGALAFPSLIGTAVLTRDALGTVALLVLIAQVAVAFLRIGVLVPLVHYSGRAGSGAGLPILLGGSAIAVAITSVVVVAASSLTAGDAPMLAAIGVGAFAEVVRLERSRQNPVLGFWLGIGWIVAFLGMVVAANHGRTDPVTEGVLYAAWAFSSLTCLLSRRRWWRSLGGRTRERRSGLFLVSVGLWRTTMWSSADIMLVFAGLLGLLVATQEYLDIGAVGDLRAAMNLSIPATMAGAAASFMTSRGGEKENPYGLNVTLLLSWAATGVTAIAIVLAGTIGPTASIGVVLPMVTLLPVAISNFAILAAARLRHAGRYKVLVTSKSIALVAQIILTVPLAGVASRSTLGVTIAVAYGLSFVPGTILERTVARRLVDA